jgi:hypothetical protein
MRRAIYILVIASLLLISLPSPVQAATTTLTVTGEGAETMGTYVGGAGTWANMNSDDGDTSYIKFDTLAVYYHCWTFSACPSSTINSVTMNVDAKEMVATADTWYKPYVRISGVDYVSTGTGFYSLPLGTYVMNSYTWTVNPSTGTAWTSTAINNAQFGLQASGNGSPSADNMLWVTYINLTVNYVATVPFVTTSAASPVSVTTATLNGSVSDIGGANVTSEGFVWDTVSHTLVSTNVTPMASGYSKWWFQNGTYTAGSFSDALTGLTSGSTYYFRATANNTYGWNYGTELSFTTIFTPTVSTSVATYIGSTTAQLNALVNNYGGQLCDVRFGYGTTSHPATLAGFNAYDTRTTWVNDTYNTGDTPMASLTGLTIGTVYYFNVQIENDAGISYGIEGTFTTFTGLNPPTGFIALPSSTSIVLTWNKDVSSPLTEIRYSPSTYPPTTADGVLVYLGPLSSATLSGLTIGTTYYFSAWGEGGGLFSTAKATTLGTTTAGTVTTYALPPTSTTSMWVAMPSELGLANFPLYSFFNWAFDAYSLPRASGWVILFILLTLILGMVSYMKAPSNNLLVTGLCIGFMLTWGTLIGMPTNCLIPIWATLAYWIIFVTIATVMNRY